MMSAGIHNVVWNGRNNHGEVVGSGVYVYQLIAGDYKTQGRNTMKVSYDKESDALYVQLK